MIVGAFKVQFSLRPSCDWRVRSMSSNNVIGRVNYTPLILWLSLLIRFCAMTCGKINLSNINDSANHHVRDSNAIALCIIIQTKLNCFQDWHLHYSFHITWVVEKYFLPLFMNFYHAAFIVGNRNRHYSLYNVNFIIEKNLI